MAEQVAVARAPAVTETAQTATSGIMPLPRIGLTVGDPAGIGPEVALKAAADRSVLEVCEPVLYGPSTPNVRRPRMTRTLDRWAFCSPVGTR